jgi:RHS repeat-associated protein
MPIRSWIYEADQKNSVLASVAVGLPVNKHYTPYGYRSMAENESVIGYVGQLIDRTLGCYFLGNGYRVYSPRLMRFLSPDRFSPFGRGGLNAYVYCLGDPVNLQDPSGQAPESKHRRYSGKIGRKLSPPERIHFEEDFKKFQRLDSHSEEMAALTARKLKLGKDIETLKGDIAKGMSVYKTHRGSGLEQSEGAKVLINVVLEKQARLTDTEKLLRQVHDKMTELNSLWMENSTVQGESQYRDLYYDTRLDTMGRDERNRRQDENSNDVL